MRGVLHDHATDPRGGVMADAATMPQRQIGADQWRRGGSGRPCTITPPAGARTSTMIDWDTARCHPDSIITAVEAIRHVSSMTLPVLVDEVDDQAPQVID
jgi:hypothetical protein